MLLLLFYVHLSKTNSGKSSNKLTAGLFVLTVTWSRVGGDHTGDVDGNNVVVEGEDGVCFVDGNQCFLVDEIVVGDDKDVIADGEDLEVGVLDRGAGLDHQGEREVDCLVDRVRHLRSEFRRWSLLGLRGRLVRTFVNLGFD